MTAKDVIKAQIEQSRFWLVSLLNDAKDILTTPPTPNGGNHPLWVAGHVIHSEAALVASFIEGKPEHLLNKWDSLFGRGTEPAPDADSAERSSDNRDTQALFGADHHTPGYFRNTYRMLDAQTLVLRVLFGFDEGRFRVGYPLGLRRFRFFFRPDDRLFLLSPLVADAFLFVVDYLFLGQ